MIKLRSSIANLTHTQNFIPNNNFYFFQIKKCASNVQAQGWFLHMLQSKWKGPHKKKEKKKKKDLYIQKRMKIWKKMLVPIENLKRKKKKESFFN